VHFIGIDIFNDKMLSKAIAAKNKSLWVIEETPQQEKAPVAGADKRGGATPA
jgi:hypothetical protein